MLAANGFIDGVKSTVALFLAASVEIRETAVDQSKLPNTLKTGTAAISSASSPILV